MSTLGQYKVNLGSNWGQPGVNLGSTKGQTAPPYLGGDGGGERQDVGGFERALKAEDSAHVVVGGCGVRGARVLVRRAQLRRLGGSLITSNRFFYKVHAAPRHSHGEH